MADSSDAPAPRLCHLIKWPDFDGYGFNLHGEKSKPGQYIGKVDAVSPAELAGLKLNDRIIEVNGTNISNENHKQVVLRIKAIPNETKLLVLNEKEDQYYKNLNIVVNGDMPNVIYMKTPVPRPITNQNNPSVTTTTTVITSNNVHEDEPEDSNQSLDATENTTTTTKAEIIPRSQSRHSSNNDDHDKGDDHISENGSASPVPGNTSSLGEKHSRSSFSVDEDASSNGLSPTPPRSSASPSPSPTLSHGNGRSGSLDFNMTAQEMRAKLAAQKKSKLDAKNAKIDARKKYDIIQTL